MSTVALPQFPINGDGDVFDENEYIHYVSNITNNIYKVKKSDFSIADSVDVGQILSADIQLDAAIQYVPLWDNMGILCSNGFTDVIIYEYDYTTGLTGRSINLHTAFGSMGWNLTDDRHYSVTAEGQFIYVSNPNPAIADTTVSASSARVNKTLNTMAGEIGVDLGSFDIWGSFSDGIDWYAVNAAAKYDSQLGPHVCKFDKDINLVASHDGAINGVLASTYGLICKLWT